MSTISCPLFSTLSIASVSHTMSVHSTMFPVYQPFELERVMPVSSGLKTRSSNKTVLPLGGDSTPVVHAQEPARDPLRQVALSALKALFSLQIFPSPTQMADSQEE